MCADQFWAESESEMRPCAPAKLGLPGACHLQLRVLGSSLPDSVSKQQLLASTEDCGSEIVDFHNAKSLLFAVSGPDCEQDAHLHRLIASRCCLSMRNSRAAAPF